MTELGDDVTGLEAWAPEMGMPMPPNPGVIRIAGIDWLDRAVCGSSSDPDAWQLDPSALHGDPPVRVELSSADLARVAWARIACCTCPVSVDCLALAAETETVPSGIWAGLDWSQRGGVPVEVSTVTQASWRRQRRAAETPAERDHRLKQMRDRARDRRAAAR